MTRWIVRILLIAVALSFLAAAPSAFAAQKSSNGLPCDPANLLPGCKPSPAEKVEQSLQSLISQPLKDLQDFIAGDFTDAANLAVAIPNLQDGNGQACWNTMQQAGAVLKDHPVPLTFHGATDLEALRLLLATANNVCRNSACTQVFTEAGNLITSAAPMSIPIPNLTTLCSKIPEIAMVAPVSTPAPTPAAAPAK